jgi:glycerol uptake facilitator-like aquaporin
VQCRSNILRLNDL